MDECSNDHLGIETNTETKETTTSEGKLVQRIARLDFILVYSAIILVSILFIITSTIGSTNTWYRNLNHGGINQLIVIALWIIATIISYAGLFLLWEDVGPNELSRDLVITIFFLISSFLSLGWAALFYYGQNIRLSMWLVGILFVYKFWLFMYIWYIKPLAALFLIPILLMYIYLMYSVAHLAYLNNITL